MHTLHSTQLSLSTLDCRYSSSQSQIKYSQNWCRAIKQWNLWALPLEMIKSKREIADSLTRLFVHVKYRTGNNKHWRIRWISGNNWWSERISIIRECRKCVITDEILLYYACSKSLDRPNLMKVTSWINLEGKNVGRILEKIIWSQNL